MTFLLGNNTLSEPMDGSGLVDDWFEIFQRQMEGTTNLSNEYDSKFECFVIYVGF